MTRRIAFCLAALVPLAGQSGPTGNARVDKLLGQMTPAEKIAVYVGASSHDFRATSPVWSAAVPPAPSAILSASVTPAVLPAGPSEQHS